MINVDGVSYLFDRLENPIDFTEQNDGNKTTATHILKGFPEELYFIMDENYYYFGYKVGETGLVINIEDERIENKAYEVFEEIVRQENIE
ncbi:hypothetical protein [Halobacillus litoralis]|uniref:hypothetical protein n=1 Tax=Halobacillus litoralis TaxID=45668 RepID=UPI001CD2A08C|nr:hypothetical protein [Halobacillus litoralis]MCA1021495.1 hypothetical protein [Halobacillus litoralis]